VSLAPLVKFRRLSLLFLATLLGACAAPYPSVDPPVPVVQAPQLQAGDTWVYVQVNGYNGLPVRTVTDTLKTAAGGFLIERHGDQPGDSVETETIAAPWLEIAESMRGATRTFNGPLARIRFPIAPGQSWREQSTMTDAYGVRFVWRTYGRAIGWERVQTPAGQFVALRIERHMNLGDYDYDWSDTQVVETYWYAPQVKRWVRLEHRYERYNIMDSPRARRTLKDWIVWELHEFRPAGAR
jgi:hypothetical protein